MKYIDIRTHMYVPVYVYTRANLLLYFICTINFTSLPTTYFITNLRVKDDKSQSEANTHPIWLMPTKMKAE